MKRFGSDLEELEDDDTTVTKYVPRNDVLTFSKRQEVSAQEADAYEAACKDDVVPSSQDA